MMKTTVVMSNEIQCLCNTKDIVEMIGDSGVIVGSWPSFRSNAKDLDIVIRSRDPEDNHNVLLNMLMDRFPWTTSNCIGHIHIQATPVDVEIFESNIAAALLMNDVKKRDALSFAQARRKATRINCYGVQMFIARKFQPDTRGLEYDL